MKIVCPECQAAYEIDVPESPSKDLSAKCAACHTKFPIKKRSLAQTNHAEESMTGPPLAQIDSGLAPDSTDDFLSGLQEGQKDFKDLHVKEEEPISEDDKNLDDYLDKLMQEEFDEPGKEILDEAEPLPATDSAAPAFEMPSEDDLDHLFDSLIEEEIKSPAKEEESADSTDTITPSEKDQEDKDLDALLDDIILNSLDEESGVETTAGSDPVESILEGSEPPSEETKEVDASVSSPLKDVEQETETPEPENLSSEKIDAKSSDEEDQASPEEKTLSEGDLQEETKDTSEAPEPADEQKEDEKSDEDLWAEAFADQEALKESDDTEPAAEQKEEGQSADTPSDPEPAVEQKEDEKSDEDLWAEAFADQEALKESDDTEPAAEQKEDAKNEEGQSADAPSDPEPAAEQKDDEKSDEDLWAEAFADQEAIAEPDDTEPDAEQKEDAKNEEEGDPEEESVEISEAVDSGDAEEESVETDEAVINSDEEVDSEQEDDPEEETETNEFGISESDYDDDDYGEDEEEHSSTKKKKFAFLSLPATRMGKLVLGGGVLAVLLTAGGAYFTLQTLAPPELTQMAKNASEVPAGLEPKDPGQSLAEKPNPALTAALGTSEPPPLATDTGSSNPAKPNAEEENDSGASSGLVAALAPGTHAVQLATIMPVAYNINDIRVLSFSLEAEMSDAESAQVVREALPVFEKITITTVEQLMDKKFFNDILYVKEKLKKDLQNNFNKTLEGGGRVKKITFKEFTVQ